MWSLAGGRSLDEIRFAVSEKDLEPYAAFTLLALAPGAAPVIYMWDAAGRLQIMDDPDIPMLTSSSFDTDRVCASRYRDLTVSPDLRTFHRSHGDHPNGSAYSTCMHREDAATVSFSRIDVNVAEVRFHYSPGAPCLDLPGHTVSLNRRTFRP